MDVCCCFAGGQTSGMTGAATCLDAVFQWEAGTAGPPGLEINIFTFSLLMAKRGALDEIIIDT